MLTVDPPHPACISDESLLRSCTVEFGRTAGPGGQHRNKVETAVKLIHNPTGIDAFASERRRQYENRRVAVRRLRMKLARKVRTRVPKRHYDASKVWLERRQGKQLSINPNHKDYPALLAEGLNVIVARGYDVAGAAGMLGISMSQLAKLIRHDKAAFAAVNDGRKERGLPVLK